MKKFLNIFVSLSLLISTFDVIDVFDITLNDTPIFTSQDENANQQQDDLDASRIIRHASALVFCLAEDVGLPANFKVKKEKEPIFKNSPQEYNQYSARVSRPPIA